MRRWAQVPPVHYYVANRSMEDRFFMNADGEMLFVPQLNKQKFVTEFGILVAEPPATSWLYPRASGSVSIFWMGPIRGYIAENYGLALTLPERGPIGANCLANARDFLYPAAAYEDRQGSFELFMKSGGRIYKTQLDQSPLDVVAWHGNYAPYKYDLRRFAPVGSISFDHPDPSIYTVLTSPSETVGTANMDFVIFPERWLVMEGQAFVRPGITSTSCRSSWGWSMAPMMQSPKVSSRVG